MSEPITKDDVKRALYNLEKFKKKQGINPSNFTLMLEVVLMTLSDELDQERFDERAR